MIIKNPTKRQIEGLNFMMDCWEYFQLENTKENGKGSRVTWHMELSLSDEHMMNEKELLKEFAYFNKRLRRKLGYLPKYTRKIERSPETGRLHLHVVYYNIVKLLPYQYDKLWRNGFIITNFSKCVEDKNYMWELANYTYDDKGEPVDAKRIIEHSQGLRALVR